MASPSGTKLKRVLACIPLVFGPLAAAEAAGAAEILVKLRHEGPHAVADCAQRRHTRGLPLAPVSRDGSDSLDRLHAELGVRGVRALFRRPDGRSFEAQRRELRERARARRAALPAAGREALPEPVELAHVYRVELAEGRDARAAAARYAADPHVAWAQPNFAADVDFEADDPLLFSSGSWGQPFADLWGIHTLRAPEAWNTARGEGVIIAVVDTGIDYEHPDLAANVWLNPGEDLDGNGRVDPADRNGVDDDGNGFVDDFHGFDFANSVDANDDGDYLDPGDVSDADPFDDDGHGSHVAGTAAAVAGNGIGVAGVAPAARIMALKGFKANESSTIEILSQGMVYAALNGARVINNSWSCSSRCPSNPLAEEVSEFARSLGVVVVTSAGNKSDDVVFYSPENRRSTIAVGASDPDDAPMFFTSTGLLVDLVAPGGADPLIQPQVRVGQRAILSTLASGAGEEARGFGLFVVDERYNRWSGTSMSAPHVAGLAALILSQRPELGVEDVRALLRASARDVGAPGPDAVAGHGVADAVAALSTALPGVRGFFSAPAVGAVVVPEVAEVAVEVALQGEVAGAELAVGGPGFDPPTFEPLSSLPGAGRFEVAWPVEGFEDGPYALRLRVWSASGAEVVEFRPISLERNRPRRFSSGERPVGAPTVSRHWVAWEEEVEADPDDEPGEGEPLGREILAGPWRGGEAFAAAAGPGEPREPRLSGGRLAWLEGATGATRLRHCALLPSGRCRAADATSEPGPHGAHTLRGRTLVWVEGADGRGRLRGCRLAGRHCSPLELPAPADGLPQSDPLLGRGRLSWQVGPGNIRELHTCTGFPFFPCEPRLVETAPGALFYGGDGDWLTQILGLGGGGLLLVCPLEEDGGCDPFLAAFTNNDFHTDTSGLRVAWAAAGPAGDADVHYCEFDPRLGECPVQRVTGSAADQRRPAIDGDHLVWVDDREGTPAIYGLELPSLAPPGDRRVRAGSTLSVRVHSEAPDGPPELTAERVDGEPLALRGLRFVDRGDGSGQLLWRPRASDVGTHLLKLSARGAGGLVARRSLEIEVLPRPGLRQSRGSR